MDLFVLFAIIIAAIIIALVFSLIKSVIKAVFLAVLIITILVGVGAFLVVQDTNDLKENFFAKEKLFVLKENDKVLAGFTFVNFSIQGSKIPITHLNADALDEVSKAVEEKDFSKYKEQYYKVIILNYSTFNESLADGISYEAKGQAITFAEDDVKSLFYSEKPVEDMLSKAAPNNIRFDMMPQSAKDAAISEMMKEFGLSSQEQIKDDLFVFLIIDLVVDEGPASVVEKLKTKEIMVYPNTAVFRAVGLIPDFVIRKVTANVGVPQGGEK